MRLKIAGGRLYDPTCGWDGEAGDLYVEDGRLVAPLPEVDREIEARGQIVTPAGIELRGQVATYGLNFLRLTNGAPSLRELGESYALLGYTHVHEPFLTGLTAGYVQRQLAGLPVVDTSASLVLNLREFDQWLRSPEHLRGSGANPLVSAGRDPGPQFPGGGALCPVPAGFLCPPHHRTGGNPGGIGPPGPDYRGAPVRGSLPRGAAG